MVNTSGFRRLAAFFLSGWVVLSGCGIDPDATSELLPGEMPFAGGNDSALLIRLVQISDTHITDEESPGRLAEFDGVVGTAWRPQEAYSTQLLDGMIRAVNRYHRDAAPIDLLINTGDVVDNVQTNELRWYLAIMDGELMDPLSGVDDRRSEELPAPLLDPHHPFQAEGIYTQGKHGALKTIPWYGVIGNHEVYAAGNFPILEETGVGRVAPLVLSWRLGLVLPVILVPDGGWSYGPVSPANPGPPVLFRMPVRVGANADRAFFSRGDFLDRHWSTKSAPAGHGLEDPAQSVTWYSRLVTETIRLIVLDTTDVTFPIPGVAYVEGAISEGQLEWFRNELARSEERGEWVIVATHHPSGSLNGLYGSAVLPGEFRGLLSEFDNVVLHLAGHSHRNRVCDRGGYIEIETGSTLDYPQTGRIIELRWREAVGEILVNYTTISHRGGDDPLSSLREVAYKLAAEDAKSAARRSARAASGAESDVADACEWLAGSPADQEGSLVLRKPGVGHSPGD